MTKWDEAWEAWDDVETPKTESTAEVPDIEVKPKGKGGGLVWLAAIALVILAIVYMSDEDSKPPNAGSTFSPVKGTDPVTFPPPPVNRPGPGPVTLPEGTWRPPSYSEQKRRTAAEKLHPTISPAEGEHAEAIAELMPSAMAGQVEAQYQLANKYYVGYWRDPAEAVKWFRKAAEQGHIAAQHTLGVIYSDGDDFLLAYEPESGDKIVLKNPIEAVKWYRKAAMQGDVDAQEMLAGRYYMGEGVLQDFVHAYAWYNLAARQGGDQGHRIDPSTGEISSDGVLLTMRDVLMMGMTSQQLAQAQALSVALLEDIEAQTHAAEPKEFTVPIRKNDGTLCFGPDAYSSDGKSMHYTCMEPWSSVERLHDSDLQARFGWFCKPRNLICVGSQTGEGCMCWGRHSMRGERWRSHAGE